MTYHVQFPGLGLEFTLDRVAFTVFGMPIYWYGILIATGLALAIVFAFSHARRFGIDSDRMVDVILIGTVCAVIGGRAFYVATAPFEYASFAEMLDIRLGGVAIYGAVIAAFLSGYFACRWRKVPILPMFDLAGMGFLLGQGIGRWGNFVNQEAFGTNTTLPWGMYSEGTYNYLLSVQATLAAEGVTVDPTQPVHPTFLYESIWCLVGVVLLASHIKKRRFNGELFLLYIIWYGLGRYWIEGLRTDALMVTSTLRTSQLVALVSVATAVVLLVAGLQRFKGAQLMVPLQVSNLKKLDAAGTYFVVDELPASASHREFVQATAAMNRRLEEFDLDEAEKVEDNSDNGEAIEEGNVVAEPQQPAEAPETPSPEDEAGE